MERERFEECVRELMGLIGDISQDVLSHHARVRASLCLAFGAGICAANCGDFQGDRPEY